MRQNGHPSKQTFQAIRIECNQELEVLKKALDELIDLLHPGGRFCIITFHSLEDRIVKNAFRRNENPCTCPPEFPVCVCGKVSKGKVITRKPILPGAEELEVNSRSKSACLKRNKEFKIFISESGNKVWHREEVIPHTYMIIQQETYRSAGRWKSPGDSCLTRREKTEKKQDI